MTDKERLEEIEKNLDPLGYGMGGHLISVNDIYWLVKYVREQAERVQELEELVEGYKIELMIKDNAKKRANQQNKRYREALEFYAEESNYDYDVKVDVKVDAIGDDWTYKRIYTVGSKILDDGGEKARKALEGEE